MRHRGGASLSRRSQQEDVTHLDALTTFTLKTYILTNFSVDTTEKPLKVKPFPSQGKDKFTQIKT